MELCFSTFLLSENKCLILSAAIVCKYGLFLDNFLKFLFVTFSVFILWKTVLALQHRVERELSRVVKGLNNELDGLATKRTKDE